mmetsp:Transcript_1092/g.3399  ORF Transcript_1092/g.3399 Transcript_1092/m.3399 type:complete len:437 (-) Transcript_1092:1187-2497(-)|eukprot:CAMPEP_0198732112 /NCGR_PEP_ID=MMETSP1475-20131203/33936_1 /TAXON_ID= ORGANISM="Unidentified sp., Strain CCMP1999" /NCGR_SAMPLE_ID=MMETSP1475 /ASSEMBLY_ACC=CAM_ASM_001111 /LENGTH=436 /DNA_ID=CAMNT_0044495161 /DNA_START=370 /DNA_END=1680 /DNA_ORIENTATION=+
MALKQKGNPGRLAAERAKLRNWSKSGLITGKKSIRVLVQSGCFAAMGVGSTSNEAIADGRKQLYRSQKEFRFTTPNLLGDIKRERLRRGVNNVLMAIQPSFEERYRLEKVFMELRNCVGKIFNSGEKLHRFGSVVSGLSLPGGDLDVCLLQYANPIQSQRRAMRTTLQAMKKHGWSDLMPLPHASVPIIKFRHTRLGITGDLSFGSRDGIVNSFLLKAYSELQPKFRDLTLLIKLWAKRRRVGDASKGYLSSYAWTLLVLFYLQSTSAIPVIDVVPALRLLSSSQLTLQQRENLLWLMRYFKAHATEVRPVSTKSGVAELLDGFFDYYARQSTLGTSVVSTRKGRVLKTEETRCYNPLRPAFLHVEDPLIDTINVGRHLRESTIVRLFSEIRRAHEIIRKTGDVTQLYQMRKLEVGELQPHAPREQRVDFEELFDR